jgi:hypothetical protein
MMGRQEIHKELFVGTFVRKHEDRRLRTWKDNVIMDTMKTVLVLTFSWLVFISLAFRNKLYISFSSVPVNTATTWKTLHSVLFNPESQCYTL